MDSMEENELQKRIKDLEEEIKLAGEALKEAESRLLIVEQTKNSATQIEPVVDDINESHHVCTFSPFVISVRIEETTDSGSRE